MSHIALAVPFAPGFYAFTPPTVFASFMIQTPGGLPAGQYNVKPHQDPQPKGILTVYGPLMPGAYKFASGGGELTVDAELIPGVYDVG